MLQTVSTQCTLDLLSNNTLSTFLCEAPWKWKPDQDDTLTIITVGREWGYVLWLTGWIAELCSKMWPNETLICCSETLTVTGNMTRNQPLISQLQNTNFITFCNHLSWCFRVCVTHCNSWASTLITSSGMFVEILGFVVGGLFIYYADLPGFGRPSSGST